MLSKHTKPLFVFVMILFSHFTIISAQDLKYKTLRDVPYLPSSDTNKYMLERCKLDIYAPTTGSGYPTLIFFHGGGLTCCDKYIPSVFQNRKSIVVSPEYRLSPKAKCPAYLEDAAAAVAWVMKNIEKYGGDPSKIYVCGHSAGAYLSTMICLNKKYLEKYDLDPDNLAGLFSYSGQMTTHFTICNERGLNVGSDVKLIDEFAPLNFIRKTKLPMYFFIGDSLLDMGGRYPQNAEITYQLKSCGSPNVMFTEIKGKDHNAMSDSAMTISLGYILSTKQDSANNIKETSYSDISIYPNPTRSGVFFIESVSEIERLGIFDNSGKIVFESFDSIKQPIDISFLRKGAYILRIIRKDKTRNKVLLVN
jgi:hypothetical protein